MKIFGFRLFEGNIRDIPEEAKESILAGAKFEQVEGDFELSGGLYASTRIGKKRENQEDALVLARHPLNDHFKMLAVADGMGGEDLGEEASQMAITMIKEWFDALDPIYFLFPQRLGTSIHKKLNEISKKINELSRKKDKPGTTMVCAIVGARSTMIVNVGDSRAYLYKDKELKQITKDQSHIQKAIDDEILDIEPDDVRFHKWANLVEQALGAGMEHIKPEIIMVNNSEYEALLLMSDGVSDCLAFDDILALSQYTRKEELARKLVQIALHHNSVKKEELGLDFYDVIFGGKDNATAAVYSPGKGIKEAEYRDLMDGIKDKEKQNEKKADEKKDYEKEIGE